jgi:Acetyltransferases, including N-acetylases of ribosomal proteins
MEKITFNEEVKKTFKSIKKAKNGKKDFSIPVYNHDHQIAFLKPLTENNLVDSPTNHEIIKLLTKWRNANSNWYPTIFEATENGTKKWLKDQVINTDDRVLFMVETLDGIPFGHMGLYRGEADNFIRGRQDILAGGMTHALRAMLKWVFNDLNMNKLFLRVFLDNKKAISFYKRCGFKEVYKIPLKKTKEKNEIKWEEITGDNPDKAERYFSVMHISCKR